MKKKQIFKSILIACFIAFNIGNSNAQCTASFTAIANYASVCEDHEFINNSIGSGTYYIWNFGDGSPVLTTTSTVSVYHSYSSNGVFYPYLLVSMSSIGSSTCSVFQQSLTVSCPSLSCTASFIATGNYASSCENYEFTNLSIGTGTLYQWNFGDGSPTFTTTSLAPVYHTYLSNGNYYPLLSVFTSSASSMPCDIFSQFINVNCFASICTASFTANGNYGSICEDYEFVNTSYGAGTFYKWNFGDGSPILTTTSTASVYHSYSSNGTFYPELVVFMSSIGSSTCSAFLQPIIISCASLSCTSSYNAIGNYASICENYEFVNLSLGVGTIYKWDFDDGSPILTTASLAPVHHSYLSNGNYFPVLSVYTSSASSLPCDMFYDYINVSCASLSCTALFSVTGNYASICENYEFVNSSTGAGTFYEWNFGDGSPILTTTSFTPVYHTYLYNGGFYPTLSVYTSSASSLPCSISQQSITVSCASLSCLSSFYIFADTLTPGSYFAYNTSIGSGLSYLWNFGDGTTSSLAFPTHTYSPPGSYIVCLTVNSGTSCVSTYCDSSSVFRVASGFAMSQINVLSPTGVKNIDEFHSVIAYPNPIENELTIEFSTYENKKLNYILVDALGRVVLFGIIDSKKVKVQTSELVSGFYNLSLISDKGENLKLFKIIK